MSFGRLIIVFCVFGLCYGAEWSYDYQTQWPGTCKEGTQQSPINIMAVDAHVDQFEAHIRGPLHFRGYGNTHVEGINNGHTLQWNNVKGSPAPVLSGGPLRGNYTFLQFHLHWLSEHAINGIKFPLEIHLVHIKTGLPVAEALKRADGLAVVGIMAEVLLNPDSRSYALEEILTDVGNLLEPTEKAVARHIDLSRVFSPNPQSFYTYHGSLTTPGCEEVVTWIVMDKPISITHKQFTQISEVNINRLDNYRNLQPVNRIVYRSMASCSTILAPSFFLFLAAAFNCFASKLASLVSKGLCVISNTKRKIFGTALSCHVK